MDHKDNGPKDLKLCGEHINLASRNRFADEAKKGQNKFRPRSALYATNKITPEHTRRPFSAGTEPTSPKLQSFLRSSNADKSDTFYYRNSEYFKDSLSIPGIVESSLLCDKLINDPIDMVKKKQYSCELPINNFGCDNGSENGSVDTCTSLGTKIKAKAQMCDNYEIEGNSLRLKKIRPHITWSAENLYDKTLNLIPEKDKLSIHVPNIKEDNTSSGVSSSSDIQKDIGELIKSRKSSNNWMNNWSVRDEPSSYEQSRVENLSGRVSFGKSHGEINNQEQCDAYPLFDTQLSLVEEESSQDSDISSKVISKSIKGDEKSSLDKNIERYMDSTSYDKYKYQYNDDDDDEDENELRFKALEEKYKKEKLNSEPHSWIESIVTKDQNISDYPYYKHKSTSNNFNNYNGVEDYTEKSYSKINEDKEISKPTSLTIPKILIEGSPVNINESDEKKVETPTADENLQTKLAENEIKPNKDYPRYLEDNESKSYTSKVIEEYKKEIASINNFHELTLKDLRNKCNTLKSHMNDIASEEMKKNIISSSSGDEDVEEIVSLDYDKDKYSKKTYNKKTDIEHVESVNEKSKSARPKLRKKVKKRTQAITTKPEIKSYSTNNEHKKQVENNKGCLMKFKAQKITMSKSTTRINHTVYIDNDKDVISWMETRANTPFEDNSSCDNAEANNKNKRNVVHFESDIVPVIKSSRVNSAEKSMVDSVDTAKSSEMGSDLVKSTMINDDDCVMNHNIALEDDDDRMVADIYSTLHETREAVNSVMEKPKIESDNAEYKDILLFLERVEKSANEDLSSLSHNQPPFALKVEELMDLSKAELAHRAVVGALAAGRAASAAASLREALDKAARASSARLKVAQATAKHQAATAAAQAAQSMTRHQKFIEQLVNEKKALTERIEQLAAVAAGAEARRGRAARAAAERLQIELRNQRQRLTAAHQRDKQAWLKHHTQKIKEMTVKGLEGELQDIERNHTLTISKIQQSGEAALTELKEQHAKELRKLKDTMTKQLEDEIDKERLFATERLEQKRKEWEIAMVKTAERAGQEAREALERAEESAKNARIQAELWKKQQEQELEQQKQLIEKESEEKKNIMMIEISQLKEKLQEEFQSFTEEHSKKQTLNLKEKEMEIRAIMRRERDREIEKAIDCMEIEAEEGRKEMHDAVRRIKDKYENDLQTLEESENIANQRCKEARNQLRDLQESYASSQISITQLEGKLKQAEEIRCQEKAKTDMLIRGAEMRGMDNLEQLRAQMQTLEQQHKDEMHQLFAKVKVVIARKDDAVTLARREASNLRERCMRLESRLTPN